jgi:hypothetical protein
VTRFLWRARPGSAKLRRRFNVSTDPATIWAAQFVFDSSVRHWQGCGSISASVLDVDGPEIERN